MRRPVRLADRRATVLAAALAVLLVAATAVAGYRMLRPADMSITASGPYPGMADYALARAYGELPAAPLIVDGRLRVYAAKQRVWADTPVSSDSPRTPFWLLRRWPAQVLGVVVAPRRSGGPVVAVQWSDGQVTGIDARTGRVLWRARTPVTGRYVGRLTGAATVYRPPDLLAGAIDGRGVVLSGGGGGRDPLVAFDAATGVSLWQRQMPGEVPGCPQPSWTGPGFVAVPTRCQGLSTVDVLALDTGARLVEWHLPGGSPAPVGCVVGRSGCRAVRTGQAAWLAGTAGALRSALALAPTDALLAGDMAVRQSADGTVSAWDAVTGLPRWTWLDHGGYVTPAPAPPRPAGQRLGRPAGPAGTAGRTDPGSTRIVAVEADRVHLLTRDHRLVTLDVDSGQERSRFSVVVNQVSRWRPGAVYASDGFVALERLRDPAATRDTTHYASNDAIVFSGS